MEQEFEEELEIDILEDIKKEIEKQEVIKQMEQEKETALEVNDEIVALEIAEQKRECEEKGHYFELVDVEQNSGYIVGKVECNNCHKKWKGVLFEYD